MGDAAAGRRQRSWRGAAQRRRRARRRATRERAGELASGPAGGSAERPAQRAACVRRRRAARARAPWAPPPASWWSPCAWGRGSACGAAAAGAEKREQRVRTPSVGGQRLGSKGSGNDRERAAGGDALDCPHLLGRHAPEAAAAVALPPAGVACGGEGRERTSGGRRRRGGRGRQRQRSAPGIGRRGWRQPPRQRPHRPQALQLAAGSRAGGEQAGGGGSGAGAAARRLARSAARAGRWPRRRRGERRAACNARGPGAPAALTPV